jgi:hypothetical protein
VETEDVVHVLRNVQQAVVPGGRILDIHPLGIDMAVRAGPRGLGFIDASDFARVVAAMDEGIDQVRSEGLLTELRSLRRLVVERYDDPAEALEEASSWEHLRLPARVARRLREAEEGPVEFVDTVCYRLFECCARPAEGGDSAHA